MNKLGPDCTFFGKLPTDVVNLVLKRLKLGNLLDFRRICRFTAAFPLWNHIFNEIYGCQVEEPNRDWKTAVRHAYLLRKSLSELRSGPPSEKMSDYPQAGFIDVSETMMAGLSEEALRKILFHSSKIYGIALHTIIPNKFPRVEDLFLLTLTTKHPIQNMEISGCENLKPEGIRSALQKCRLRHLNLTVPCMTLALMQEIVTNQTDLRTLSISATTGLNTDTLALLPGQLNALESLTLESYKEKLPVEAVNALMGRLNDIKHLTLNGCKTFSEDTLQLLFDQCPRLESLTVRGLENAEEVKKDFLLFREMNDAFTHLKACIFS
jgi:hypothetical protein